MKSTVVKLTALTVLATAIVSCSDSKRPACAGPGVPAPRPPAPAPKAPAPKAPAPKAPAQPKVNLVKPPQTIDKNAPKANIPAAKGYPAQAKPIPDTSRPGYVQYPGWPGYYLIGTYPSGYTDYYGCQPKPKKS